MMNKSAPLLPAETIGRFKKLGVALVLDGITAAGIDIPNGGCMDAAIMPVGDGMSMAGTALTVETSEGDNFPIHVASYSQPGEGYVLVVDGKGFMGRAYVGDLILGACQAAGFEGMVVDGCTRDRDGTKQLGFPTFSRGFMPRSPIKKNEGNINTEIMCAGVHVCPGDLIIGDCDGVCVVPIAHIPAVLEQAEKKCDYERKRHTAIAAYSKAKLEQVPLPQLAPQWVLDMIQS